MSHSMMMCKNKKTSGKCAGKINVIIFYNCLMLILSEMMTA
ncbi:Uncharacterised protein [Enterobacter cloacae]|nr:Uncharacterised protein [Enterobacter cloacae]